MDYIYEEEPDWLKKNRRDYLHNRFYGILDELKERVCGYRYLESCTGRMGWPHRGMYFFFEDGEFRENGADLRVTRVGTHAVSSGSGTSLWSRLRTHRGSVGGRRAGGGNHRGSVFRLHVGGAIIGKEGLDDKYPSWGVKSSASCETRDFEYPVEKKVSEYIRGMPFLWLKVDDEAGRNSERAYLEKSSIMLLSNYSKNDESVVDPPSKNWLGRFNRNELVRESGLWNVNHVADSVFDDRFIDRLERKVMEM